MIHNTHLFVVLFYSMCVIMKVSKWKDSLITALLLHYFLSQRLDSFDSNKTCPLTRINQCVHIYITECFAIYAVGSLWSSLWSFKTLKLASIYSNIRVFFQLCALSSMWDLFKHFSLHFKTNICRKMEKVLLPKLCALTLKHNTMQCVIKIQLKHVWKINTENHTLGPIFMNSSSLSLILMLNPTVHACHMNSVSFLKNHDDLFFHITFHISSTFQMMYVWIACFLWWKLHFRGMSDMCFILLLQYIALFSMHACQFSTFCPFEWKVHFCCRFLFKSSV